MGQSFQQAFITIQPRETLNYNEVAKALNLILHGELRLTLSLLQIHLTALLIQPMYSLLINQHF